MSDMLVVRNRIAGWDVKRPHEEIAVVNCRTRAAALKAAELRAAEEGGGEVELREREVHGIDDARIGVVPAFGAFGTLLFAVTLLATTLALVAALTGFGA